MDQNMFDYQRHISHLPTLLVYQPVCKWHNNLVYIVLFWKNGLYLNTQGRYAGLSRIRTRICSAMKKYQKFEQIQLVFLRGQCHEIVNPYFVFLKTYMGLMWSGLINGSAKFLVFTKDILEKLVSRCRRIVVELIT